MAITLNEYHSLSGPQSTHLQNEDESGSCCARFLRGLNDIKYKKALKRIFGAYGEDCIDVNATALPDFGVARVGSC